VPPPGRVDKHRQLGLPTDPARDIGDLQPEPQVRFVCPETIDGLREPQAGKRGRRLLGRALRHDAAHQQLHFGEDILLGGEGHLQVDLVELARAAIRPGGLVAKAGGDLEVALHSAHHQQLLELLRGLRQGVELAGVQPARDQKVPGALG
jgi:hypothetical protein